MPEISRFYGIVIRMYGLDHAPPHMHAVYGEQEALIRGLRISPSSAAACRPAPAGSSSSGRRCTRTNCKRRGSGHGASSLRARSPRSNDAAETVQRRTTASRSEEKMARLATQWREQRAEAERLDTEIEANLGALGF